MKIEIFKSHIKKIQQITEEIEHLDTNLIRFNLRKETNDFIENIINANQIKKEVSFSDLKTNKTDIPIQNTNPIAANSTSNTNTVRFNTNINVVPANSPTNTNTTNSSTTNKQVKSTSPALSETHNVTCCSLCLSSDNGKFCNRQKYILLVVTIVVLAIIIGIACGLVFGLKQ